MTPNIGDSLWLWVHWQLANELFFKLGILTPLWFKEFSWRLVYDKLHKVSHLFQLWECKQVMNKAGTNLIQSWYKPHHDPTCPICEQCVEKCAHVLSCNEAVQVYAMYQSISILDKWVNKLDTHIQLHKYIIQYAKGRGGGQHDSCTTWYWQAIHQIGGIKGLDWLEKFYGRDDI